MASYYKITITIKARLSRKHVGRGINKQYMLFFNHIFMDFEDAIQYLISFYVRIN